MSTTNAPETAINELTTDELTTKALNKRYEGLLTVRARVVKGKGAWYWTHLVRNTDTNLPKAVKLRCSLCDAVFSASNPSRTVSLPSWILRGSASSTLFLLRRIQSFELFSPISSKRDFAAARLDVKYKEANSETESRIRDAIQIASEVSRGNSESDREFTKRDRSSLASVTRFLSETKQTRERHETSGSVVSRCSGSILVITDFLLTRSKYRSMPV